MNQQRSHTESMSGYYLPERDSIDTLLERDTPFRCATLLRVTRYANGSLRERHMFYALLNALERIAALETKLASLSDDKESTHAR